MMANLTRAEILARKVGREIVPLPDGSTVEIRGVTHAEVSTSNKFSDINERTAYIVSKALVDPELSFEDVLAWSQTGDAGDITTISEAAAVLSRLNEGAGKSGVPRA
jgi:hypothetical protein